MPTNTTTAVNNRTYVNGVWVMTFADTAWGTGFQRASLAAGRLDSIFRDASRDLDFITPSFQQSLNGGYCVVCPPVRYPSGPTYFSMLTACSPTHTQLPWNTPRNKVAPCDPNSTLCLPELMYSLDNTTDDRTTGQVLITPVAIEDVALHNMERYQIALVFANNIRAALDPTNTNALGNSPISQLVSASVITPAGTLQAGVSPTFYGDPGTQGLTQGNPNNICSSNTHNGEIFHPLDYTVALSDELYASYANRWVQVCNPVNGICIAARVTDSSGPGGRPDLAKGGLYIPLSNPGTVDIKTLP